MDDSQKLGKSSDRRDLPSRCLQTTIINLKLAFRDLTVFQFIDSALLNAGGLIDGTFGVLKV